MNLTALALSTFLSLFSLGACNPTPAPPSDHGGAQGAAQRQDIRSEIIKYTQGDQVLEGYLAYDANAQDTRPGVMIIHDWDGLGDYEKRRARELAQLGYVAFAADIYGQGVRPTPPKDSAAEAQKYYQDRDLAKARAQAGFEILKNRPEVNSAKLAAMGYCFGGTMTLELARSGAEADGFVSFHGGLNPVAAEAGNIKAPLLVLHGADDPFVSAEDVQAFQSNMNNANVPLQFIAYPGAVHAFTVPAAGDDNSTGAAYNAAADMKSWDAMQAFFKDIFSDV